MGVCLFWEGGEKGIILAFIQLVNPSQVGISDRRIFFKGFLLSKTILGESAPPILLFQP